MQTGRWSAVTKRQIFLHNRCPDTIHYHCTALKTSANNNVIIIIPSKDTAQVHHAAALRLPNRSTMETNPPREVAMGADVPAD